MPKEEGLLFYVSGENGPRADYAEGSGEPTFYHDVETVEDGVNGRAFRCGRDQLFAYRAPGNIYAQRGTLSFFWRSRYPVGPTEFPIFRVGYSDHSSWDAVWLRIDYNGRGFDAFVTDANLARTRVSCPVSPFPAPEEWIHLALAWDETSGIRFYVNGRPAGSREARAVYYSGLDQFGPHSRIISHWSVQSAFNYIRGGDIDEIRIYDRMLSDENVAALARCEGPLQIPFLLRTLGREPWRSEWFARFGFDCPSPPLRLAGIGVSVRKAEIHEAYDLKRWWWKATDGIRETTWPGVYNRSRLPGRLDYFVLPDWDCYSVSGKEIVFTLPDEPCNYLEISGSAHGRMYDAATGEVLFERPAGIERSFHVLPRTLRGTKIRFVNDEREEPIADLTALFVADTAEPEAARKQAFRLAAGGGFAFAAGPGTEEPRFGKVLDFIRGRYAKDERAVFLLSPEAAEDRPRETKPSQALTTNGCGLPFLHLLVPYGEEDGFGLDGIALDLPPLAVRPTHGAAFALNLQVKDPLWFPRNLLNFTFLLKPGEAKTLWLDTRDRILPSGGVLYLTLAGAGKDLTAAALEGLRLRLVFKPAEEAKAEHVADRFIQVKDNYSHLVEEYPRSEKFSLYNRFMADLGELLKVDPEHVLGRLYRWDFLKQDKPAFSQSPVPEGVPAWAWRQVEYLRGLKRFLSWWIDERQIENGEFGGGLSDDGDLTSWWPGPALVGLMPDKIRRSLLAEMEAFYANGMFTGGLCTIQTDQLHAFEEGITALGQCLVLDEAKPKHLERAMETARAVKGLTAVNGQGHRHFFSAYYGATKAAREYPWNFSNPDSYHVLHPAYMLVRYNGNPCLRKFVLELADSLLEHFRDGVMHSVIDFDTDEDEYTAKDREWPLFAAAYDFTGDEKYLRPLKADQAWTARNLGPVDGEEAARAYEALIEAAALREYINTEGHLWVDRVVFDIRRIQRDRLGGLAHERFACYPRHLVSWRFEPPFSDESLAVLVPYAAKDRLKILVFNLAERETEAFLTGADVTPGRWKLRQGLDLGGGDMGPEASSREVDFERSRSLALRFPPRTATVLRLELLEAGVPYRERPDLGLSEEDVELVASPAGKDSVLRVKVHGLGGVPSPEAKIVLKRGDGSVLSSSVVPPLAAPEDLLPKTATVELSVPAGADLDGAWVEIDPENEILEITKSNNRCFLKRR